MGEIRKFNSEGCVAINDWRRPGPFTRGRVPGSKRPLNSVRNLQTTCFMTRSFKSRDCSLNRFQVAVAETARISAWRSSATGQQGGHLEIAPQITLRLGHQTGSNLLIQKFDGRRFPLRLAESRFDH